MNKEEVNKLLQDKVEEGAYKSYIPQGIKNYLIDIDGTITDDVPNEEPERMGTCEPFPDALVTLTNGLMKVILFVFSHREQKIIEKLQKLG